mmetsp:Transcript_11772/g.17050  ORF Transcript_11772/g.17050 Transcript_11772/m.17050 type:complete len:94 (-) Transcript_11772:415-696(-)
MTLGSQAHKYDHLHRSGTDNSRTFATEIPPNPYMNSLRLQSFLVRLTMPTGNLTSRQIIVAEKAPTISTTLREVERTLKRVSSVEDKEMHPPF